MDVKRSENDAAMASSGDDAAERELSGEPPFSAGPGNGNAQFPKVEHLEQLLRTCAEALANAHSGIPSPERLSRAPTTTVDDILLGNQQVSEVAENTALEPKFTPKKIKQLEEYDESKSQKAHEEDEIAWHECEKKWKAQLDKIANIDIWSHQFPDCTHHEMDSAHSICHSLTDPALRRQCQKDLVLARLNLEQDSDKIKDIDHFLPWLSVVAYKLSQIHRLTRAFSALFIRRQTTLGPGTEPRSNLLVQILRYFYEGPWHYLSLAHTDELTIGSLLSFCYQRGALVRPVSASSPRLESNFRHAIHGLWALNIIQTPRYSFMFESNIAEQRLPAVGSYILDMLPLEAISRTVAEIEFTLQQRQPDHPLASGENVRCSDLHLGALRNVGGLRMVFTSCDRDHLFLDQENGVLRLSYFNRILVPEFYKYIPALGSNDVVHTWMLLLGYRKLKDDTSELERVSLPPELSAYETHLRRSRFPLSRPFRRNGSASLFYHSLPSPKMIPDIFDKLTLEPQPLPKSVPYDYFGRYEERIRILRHYMDTRKPAGLRNLYHDRRDSLTFYTFWAVVIFGGTSMLLAAMGVALGVAQTIAAFRQLERTG